MVDCRNCEFGGRPSYEWPCNICTDSSAFKQKPKPTTNADRIREMSDEELAGWLQGMKYSPVCDSKCYDDYEKYGEQRTFCTECWLNWLQSPAGGDGDGR